MPTTPLMASPPKTDLLSLKKYPNSPPTPTPLVSSPPTPKPTLASAAPPAIDYSGSLTQDQLARMVTSDLTKSGQITPTPTIDTAMAQASQGNLGVPTPPTPMTTLPQTEQDQFTADLNARIQNLTIASNDQIRQITKLNEQNLGASTAFLSKVGALGRTISGAPVETGLGVLSNIQNQTNQAIQQETEKLNAAIAGAKVDEQKLIQGRIDKLNSLQQTNFDNAIKAIETAKTLGESRYLTMGTNIFDTQTSKFIIGPAAIQKTTDTTNSLTNC